MSDQNPEYLDRPEPVRIPAEEFRFKQQRRGIAEREAGLSQGGCLARDIANAKGFNSASEAQKNSCGYGDVRIREDGTIEKLIGCSSCGAMCTVVSTERKEIGPGTEANPNQLISVAEAPQPNPWGEVANFGDCKIGIVKLPETVDGLTRSLGLTEIQKLVVRVLSGNID